MQRNAVVARIVYIPPYYETRASPSENSRGLRVEAAEIVRRAAASAQCQRPFRSTTDALIAPPCQPRDPIHGHRDPNPTAPDPAERRLRHHLPRPRHLGLVRLRDQDSRAAGGVRRVHRGGEGQVLARGNGAHDAAKRPAEDRVQRRARPPRVQVQGEARGAGGLRPRGAAVALHRRLRRGGRSVVCMGAVAALAQALQAQRRRLVRERRGYVCRGPDRGHRHVEVDGEVHRERPDHR